jgi:hypothetical protein
MRLEMLRFGVAAFSIVSVFVSNAAAASTSTVVVQISGQLSSNPNDVQLTGNPGAFPIPDLFGGSFAGEFSYDPSQIKGPVGFGFRLSSASIDVRDVHGDLVYRIQDVPNPMYVNDGSALFAIGPSFLGQPGYVSRTPTDLRFERLNSEFTSTAINPPSAAALNTAIFGPYNGGGTQLSLDDDVNPFDGWSLPAVSATFHAELVPEPCTLVLLSLAIVLGMIAWLDRAWIGK